MLSEVETSQTIAHYDLDYARDDIVRVILSGVIAYHGVSTK